MSCRNMRRWFKQMTAEGLELPVDVREHLEECEGCRAYAAMEQALPPAMADERCPDGFTLLAHRDGRLTAGRSTEVATHIATCQECTETFQEAMEALGAPVPEPVRVISWATDMTEDARTRLASWMREIRDAFWLGASAPVAIQGVRGVASERADPDRVESIRVADPDGRLLVEGVFATPDGPIEFDANALLTAAFRVRGLGDLTRGSLWLMIDLRHRGFLQIGPGEITETRDEGTWHAAFSARDFDVKRTRIPPDGVYLLWQTDEPPAPS